MVLRPHGPAVVATIELDDLDMAEGRYDDTYSSVMPTDSVLGDAFKGRSPLLPMISSLVVVVPSECPLDWECREQE